MADVTLDQAYDWTLNAYKKAQEKGVPLTGFVLTVIGGVAVWGAIYAAKHGFITFLKNKFFGIRNSDSSPVPRPKTEQKVLVGVRTMLDQICKDAFPKDAESYKILRDRIGTTNMDEQKLLTDSIDDLCEKLGLEDSTEIETLEKFRVDFRYKYFQKIGPLKIKDHNVDTFDWHQVCQLLEDQVKPSSRRERLHWYKHIENSKYTAYLLVKERDKIIEDLNLNQGQRENFKKLVNNLGYVNKDTGKGSITMRDNAKAALVISGGSVEHKGDINVSDSTHFYGAVPEKKKKKLQQDDHDETIDNDDEDNNK